MQPCSINTTAARQLDYSARPIVDWIATKMIRGLILSCALSSVVGIIVTDPPPVSFEYKYSYHIEDPASGDTKSQHEVRQGSLVRGQYSVVEPDGTKRIVDYSSHPSTGFTAVVHNEAPTTMRQDTPKNYVIPIKSLADLKILYETQAQSLYTSIETPNNTYEKLPDSSQRKLTNGSPKREYYFTPVNKITKEYFPAKQGQYFIPAKEF